MSDKVRIELNSEGVRELLRSPGIAAACQAQASAIAGRAGEGYRVSTYIGVNRANASVITETDAAIRDNMKNNTLLKAVK